MIKYDSNLENGFIEQDIRELFSLTFSLFNMAESNKTIYKRDPESTIPMSLITCYYERVKPNYNDMIYNFRRKYVANELLVEKNDTKEQRQGLNLVYDYIQKYPVDGENFDIFVNTLQINSYLWKYVDEKYNEDLTNKRNEILRLKEEAKKEKNAKKYKEAIQLERDLNKINSEGKIGGRFRTNGEEVHMLGLDINVPTGVDAMNYMNEYLNPEKREEFKKYYNSDNIFDYINYCVRITTQMIKTQPFVDGNKRTFRSLLNLMFKVRNIPPVYIKSGERKEYKKSLYKAMKDEDYEDLYKFYYFKICDSIYELDVKPYIDRKRIPVKKGFGRGI